jgi:predicted RNA binding protein YcfA (HicA-like mRNA interferase family)
MTGKALARYAESNGWHLIRRRGSHMIYAHPHTPDRIVIPDHGAKDLARGMVHSISKQIAKTWSPKK